MLQALQKVCVSFSSKIKKPQSAWVSLFLCLFWSCHPAILPSSHPELLLFPEKISTVSPEINHISAINTLTFYNRATLYSTQNNFILVCFSLCKSLKCVGVTISVSFLELPSCHPAIQNFYFSSRKKISKLFLLKSIIFLPSIL